MGTLFDGEPRRRCGNCTNKEASVWKVFIEKVEVEELQKLTLKIQITIFEGDEKNGIPS